MGATEIAKAIGCKRRNVYKALKAAGLNYADALGPFGGGGEKGPLWNRAP
jgi:hypothetical protein